MPERRDRSLRFMRSYAPPLVLFLLAPLLMAAGPLEAVAAEGYSAEIAIDSSGVVAVAIVTEVSIGINEIAVPVEPLIETLEVSVDGTALASIYEGRVLYVFSDRSGTARISYLALVSETERGVLAFNIVGSSVVRLILDPNVILLTLPANLLGARLENGRLVLELRGPELIEYALRAPPEATAEAPVAPAPTPAKEEKPEETAGRAPLLIPVAIAIVGAVGVAAVLLRGKRGSPPPNAPTPVLEESALDELDQRILDALKGSGGSLLQSELLRVLGTPKSTLWRHVRKLERLGFVEVRKEPSGMNRITLRERR